MFLDDASMKSEITDMYLAIILVEVPRNTPSKQNSFDLGV